MPAVDGKYCTLVQLKQYMGLNKTDPNNTTVYNGAVQGTPDDAVLSNCIINAEATFEQKCGTGFDQQTYTLVQGFRPFVDGDNFLHIFARERGPVTAITAVQVRDVFSKSTTWQPATFDAANDVILPAFYSSDTHPLPESWHVKMYLQSPALLPRASGQILVKWSYTGGFATIPQSLTELIQQMANYIYKVREMPIGKVVNQPLGTMSVPSNFPPNIISQINLWKPVYG
jgi:hypothetical protein